MRMRSRWHGMLGPAAWLGCSLLPGVASADAAGTGIDGIWKLEQKTFAYSGVLYSTISANGSCSQILKFKALGITHWAADRCSWTREQSTMNMTVTAFPGSPDKVGTKSTLTVVSVDATSLVIINEKKDTLTYTRVPVIPDEFQTEFQKAFAPPPPK